MKRSIIKIDKLKKEFDGIVALNEISFEVEKGQIFGLLGPSGSGKTTTINIITGQEISNSGTSHILGIESSKLTSKELEKIGIVTDSSGYYEKMSLYNNLIFFAKYYDVEEKEVEKLLKRVGLFDNRRKIAGKLSTGMRQRMLLVRSLINKPEILFLDEPTSGLDPNTTRTIHNLILELKEQGVTIFLTTHDMFEATLLCDTISLLNEGNLIEKGSPKEIILRHNHNKNFKVTYSNELEEVLSFSELRKIVNRTRYITSLHSCEPTLEDVFVELTGGELNV